MKREGSNPEIREHAERADMAVSGCRATRSRIERLLSRFVGADALWVQRHIAGCPRCRRRFASLGRVDLALSLIKTEPHKLDLLKRANSRAVDVLRRDLRHCERAEDLKTVLPHPSLWQRLAAYSNSTVNLAACLLLLLLMKIGIFTSVDRFQSASRDTVEHYYAAHVGDEMADDIFHA